MRWFLLFVLLVLVEIYGLTILASAIGGWLTFGFIIASAVLGVVLATHQGQRVRLTLFDSLSRGTLPEGGMLDGLLLLIGAALLVVPGVLTDVLGLLLFIPPIRRPIARYALAWLGSKVRDAIAPSDSVTAQFASPHDPMFVHRFATFDMHHADYGSHRGDVLDTEGVEVQHTLLLGDGTHHSDTSHDDTDHLESTDDSECSACTDGQCRDDDRQCDVREEETV